MKIFEILLLTSLQQVYSEIFMEVMDLKTTNTFFKIHVIPFNEETVRISSKSITISGVLEKTFSSKNPNFYFDNLVVSEPGIIEITAEGLNNGSIASTSLTVEDAIKKVKIQLPDDLIKIDENLYFIINITNQYGSYLSKETEIYINDGINEYKSYTKKSVYYGNVTYTLKGSYNIIVIIEDNKKQIKEIQEFEVFENPIRIIMDDKKNLTSKEPQNLEIILEISDSKKINATLELKCLNYCSGTIFRTFDEYSDDLYEVEIYKNISLTFYILSSGTFNWVVTIENKFTRNSDSFTVVNSAKKISSYFSNISTTAYFPVNYTIEVYGDDYRLYLAPILVTINDSSGASSVKEQTFNIEKGTEYIEIYYDSFSDNIKYVITCKEPSIFSIIEDNINVYPNKLILTKTKNWYPKNKADSFRFNIGVYNHEMNFKETRYGNYNLKITLDPNESSLSGSQLSLMTLNGEAKINDLYLNSAGTYTLNISCLSCETLVTNKFILEGNSCKFESSAVVCMSVISIILIFFSVVFCCIDDDGYRLKANDICKYILNVHPLLSLRRKQEFRRRGRNIIHILSSGLFLQVMIGAMYFYYDTPDICGGNEFNRFDKDDLKIGGVAFGFQQLWIFFLIFLNYITIGYEGIVIFSMFFEVQTIISGIIGTIVMSLQVCKGFTLKWTYNFIIFYSIDLIFMKFIHILILLKLRVKNVKRVIGY